MKDLNIRLEATFTKHDETIVDLQKEMTVNHEHCLKKIDELIDNGIRQEQQIQESLSNVNTLMDQGKKKDKQIEEFMSMMRQSMNPRQESKNQGPRYTQQ